MRFRITLQQVFYRDIVCESCENESSTEVLGKPVARDVDVVSFGENEVFGVENLDNELRNQLIKAVMILYRQIDIKENF